MFFQAARYATVTDPVRDIQNSTERSKIIIPDSKTRLGIVEKCNPRIRIFQDSTRVHVNKIIIAFITSAIKQLIKWSE